MEDEKEKMLIIIAITGILVLILGINIGYMCAGHKYCLEVEKQRQLAQKHEDLIRLYDIWIMVKQNSNRIDEYLIKKEIHSVVIYGMSYVGIRLYYELKNTDVIVKYGMDMNPRTNVVGIETKPSNYEKEGSVDAIIVTAITSFDSIKEKLSNLGYQNIIAIDEILYELV